MFSDKVLTLHDAMSTAKITSIDQTITQFVERLVMRQRLGDVSKQLSQLEHVFLGIVENEASCTDHPSSLHRILQKHEALALDHQTFGGQRTHVHALKSVEIQTTSLLQSFQEFSQLVSKI